MFSFAFHPRFKAYGNTKQSDMLGTLAWVNSWPLCNIFAGSREHLLLRESLYGRFTGLVLVEPQDWVATDVSHVALLAQYDGTLIVAGSQSMEQLRECLPCDSSCRFLYKVATNRHSLRNALWRRGPGETYRPERFSDFREGRILQQSMGDISYDPAIGPDYSARVEVSRHRITHEWVQSQIPIESLGCVNGFVASRRGGRCILQIGLTATRDMVYRSSVLHSPQTVLDYLGCSADLGSLLASGRIQGRVEVVPTDYIQLTVDYRVEFEWDEESFTYNRPDHVAYPNPYTVQETEPQKEVQSSYTRRSISLKEKEDVTHNQAGISNNLVDSSPPRRIGRVSKKRGTL